LSFGNFDSICGVNQKSERSNTVKIHLTTLLALTLLCVTFMQPAWALESKVCACGYHPGGDCEPCKDITDESDPPTMEDDTTLKDVQCECGYNPGLGCVPCKDTTLDQQEREKANTPSN
jgi:hypothetical protein